jgi:hypothetical protein
MIPVTTTLKVLYTILYIACDLEDSGLFRHLKAVFGAAETILGR